MTVDLLTAGLCEEAAAAQFVSLIPSGLFLGALSLEVVQAPRGLADKPPG